MHLRYGLREAAARSAWLQLTLGERRATIVGASLMTSPPDRDDRGVGPQPSQRLLENVRKVDNNNGQFAVGTGNVQIKILPGGALVLLAEPAAAPVRIPPPRHLLPSEPNRLVGREAALSRLHRLIDEGRVEITGENGIGKTALVSHLLHELARTREHLVYLDCSDHEAADGVLAELFFAFYDCAVGVAPDPRATPGYLQPVAGLVALDHVELDRTALENVLSCVPRCEILVVNNHRRLAGLAALQSVSGLAAADGAALLAQELGRVLTPAQDAELQELAVAWEGHPLRLYKCADLLREGAAPIRELIDAGVAVHGLTWLNGRVVGTIESGSRPLSRRVLVLLAAVAPGAIAAEQIAALTEAPEAVELLRELRRKGLLEAHSPRYSIRDIPPSVSTSAAGATDYAIEAARWYGEWAPSAPLTDLYASAGALIRLQRAASANEQWSVAVALARGLDMVLALTGRWKDWADALRLAELAAQAASDLDAAGWVFHQQGVHAVCTNELERADTSFQHAAALRRRLGRSADTAEHNRRVVERLASGAGTGERLRLRAEKPPGRSPVTKRRTPGVPLDWERIAREPHGETGATEVPRQADETGGAQSMEAS
jgi:AAA ATPase domain